MKSLIVLGLFFTLSLGSAYASSGTTLPPHNGTKEDANSGGKESNGKYTFALFNFFAAQTKTTTDSTAVKKEEPAVMDKGKANSGL